ncbi:MAG: metal-dependent hydrolase [Halopenitus sp.]
MPSTLVHVGFAALIGTALLADRFDVRALLVVLAFAVLPDLDTFVGLWLLEGGHRTALHNLVLPTLLLVGIWVDALRGKDSLLRSRWGPGAYRVAWVGILGGWITAGVLLDAYHNGANLLWPLHDEFIDLSGHLLISDQRGIEQTFISFESSADGGTVVAERDSKGTSNETHYATGADPNSGSDAGAERWFYLFDRGEFLLLSLAGYLSAGWRLYEERTPDLPT